MSLLPVVPNHSIGRTPSQSIPYPPANSSRKLQGRGIVSIGLPDPCALAALVPDEGARGVVSLDEVSPRRK